MVNTVIRNWLLVIRRKEKFFSSLSHCAGVKIGFLILITNSQFLIPVHARERGVHGVLYPIEEQDPIALIQQKLKAMEDSGELKQRSLELQKIARASVERPKPTLGITKATKSRVFYYDPSYEVKADLKDHLGRIVAKKGTKINPLEAVSLSQNLLFFDGDDEEQLAWAKEQLQKGSVRLILTKGAPLALAEELRVPVYFDQNGVLTKKLGVQYVPAVVSQDNLRLRIEEVILPPPLPVFSIQCSEIFLNYTRKVKRRESSDV